MLGVEVRRRFGRSTSVHAEEPGTTTGVRGDSGAEMPWMARPAARDRVMGEVVAKVDVCAAAAAAAAVRDLVIGLVGSSCGGPVASDDGVVVVPGPGSP